MNEHLPSTDPTPTSPSAELNRILLEAAQFYLLAEPSEHTIYEITPPDEGQFERDVRKLWLQRIGGDDAQFEVDFEEIKRQIRESGAETLIEEQRVERAEARRLKNEALPSVTPEATQQLGASGIGRFFRRRG